MKVIRLPVVVCLASTVLVVTPAAATAAGEGVVLNSAASTCDIAGALGIGQSNCPRSTEEATAPAVIRTRGLSIGNTAPMSAPPPQVAALPAPQEHTAAFQIRFQFGSARLTDDARRLLNRVGEVLSSPDAKGSRFRIIGHTDAVGSAVRNQWLSEQRADAVKAYLEHRFHLAASRLEAVGKGAKDLLNPADPAGAENRRVEITNLGV